MLLTAGFYSCAGHNIDPGVGDLNSCPYSVCFEFPFIAQLPPCALNFDEEAGWHVVVGAGGIQVIYCLLLDPFPALPLGNSSSGGLNYVSQAPLPIGFL